MRGRVAALALAGLTLLAALAILVAPADAQQARGHRIGFISSASSSAMVARDEAFRQGLRALGYVVGQNIMIEAVGGGFTWGAILIKW